MKIHLSKFSFPLQSWEAGFTQGETDFTKLLHLTIMNIQDTIRCQVNSILPV